MQLEALSSRYGGFYVPAFSIRIGNKDLVRDHAIGVAQVEVDLSLGAAGRFSFNVVNSYSAKERAFLDAYGGQVLELLKFGTSVDIACGYGDHRKLDVLIAGMITEVTTGFAESGAPELTVSGYDHSFPMTLGKRSQSWAKSADSDAVLALAKDHNLSTDVESTKQKLAQIEQNQESDFEFLKKLAERNHFEFYVDPKSRLRFGPPRDKGDGLVTLSWGQGLMSFKPEANLAAQVSEVHVYGWDQDNKKAIVGKAVAGEESGIDPNRKSAGVRVRDALGKGPVLELRQPVFTEAEARRRAQAVLNDHAKKFLTGEAECIGLPDLLPDRNVNLANLGKPFSKTYYIQQTTHKVDGSGYRTKLKVKETSL